MNITDIPNLNFGLSLTPMKCEVHPVVVTTIIDHYMRRKADHEFVIGTLLGVYDGSIVKINNCFGVPYDKYDGKSSMDQEYNDKMIRFHQRVLKKDSVVGLFYTTSKIDEEALRLFVYYSQVVMKKAQIRPLIMVMDPELQNYTMSVKIYSYMPSKFALRNLAAYSEVKFNFMTDNTSATGLDILCHGQDYYDTLALLLSEDKLDGDYDQEQLSQQIANQKLYQDIELAKKNLLEVISLLQKCEVYIGEVQRGERKPKSEIGRMLNNCLSRLADMDTKSLEAMVQENYQDLVMVGSLSKLTKVNVELAEKINSLLSNVLI